MTRAGPTDAHLRSRDPVIVIGIVLVALAAFAFQIADTVWLPLNAWDESRLAVNALEMYKSGNYIVTTYEFAPDLWNTKPPLLIDIMALSMHLAGPTPFGLRLPSVIAALLTTFMVVRLVFMETGALLAGLFAGLVLLSHPVFSGMHGGATGDYDTLLTLFTTGYGIILFRMIGSEHRQPGQAVLAGVLVGLAALTKGVAGFVPGVSIAAYALVFSFPHIWRKLPDYIIVVGIGLAIGFGYYFVRGLYGADYIDAVLYNEPGRFSTTVERLGAPPDFYLRTLIGNPLEFRKPWFVLPLALGIFLLPSGHLRKLGVFALFQSVGIILIFSLSATKVHWYIIPALPWVAVAVAIGGFAIYRAMRGRKGSGLGRALATGAPVLAALMVTALVATAVWGRYLNPEKADRRAFGVLIAQAQTLATGQPLMVVDSGFPNKTGFVHYSPTLRFHRLAADLDGIRVDYAASIAAASGAKLIGSCDPALRDAVASEGQILWRGSDCVIVGR